MWRLSLDGDWQLRHYPEGQRIHAGPADLQAADLPVFDAIVPGNVELDLERAGVLDDPFYAANIHRLRALEGEEWWYTREFSVPADVAGRPCELVCAGLDTLASVWVNDVRVGQSANMLIEHRFDVSQALRPGQANTITIRLGSALREAGRHHYDAANMSWENREEGLFIRKAPHVWGWDIMPRAVSAGIWRSVWIEERLAEAIEQLYYWTIDAGPAGATLGVRFQYRTEHKAYHTLSLHFHGQCGDHSFDYEWPVEFLAGGCRIPVPGARLWWPQGYGEPALYTVTASLRHAGQTLAERTDRIGIRRLRLDRTDAAGRGQPPALPGPGKRADAPTDPDSQFVFYVNDEPIMVKGTNWVPLDAFHSRDRERVERSVDMLADLGCNMVRCWGGNVYEDHPFFDLCDRHGIMVWQDFAFACCRYPQTEAFLAQVRSEAESVVEKLRNHPSLAVWCGDNEIDMAYNADGLLPEYNRLTREVIPQVIARCDPYRPFVPSSPYLPPARPGQTLDWQSTPEQHLWGPRGYFKSPFYTQHTAHFIGEMGYHGCPNVSSIRRFISPERMWPWYDGEDENPEWRVHAVYHWEKRGRDRDRIKLMADQVREMFGKIPDTLDEFALASQITQAEAKKYFVESTRLRKWRTSGVLWWNLIDGWPQFSDAIVDYYGGVKLAYHYLWRAQRPVCVIVGEPEVNKHLPVVVCNDTRQPAQVSYRVWECDGGQTVAEGRITAPANQNWQVARIRTYSSDQKLYLVEWQQAGAAGGANHYLAGSPAFDLARYRAWLPALAALPRSFDVEAVAR